MLPEPASRGAHIADPRGWFSSGPVWLFVNAENLADVRQTRWDPLLRGVPAADGRQTVDAWAPLDGRVVNGGVRWKF